MPSSLALSAALIKPAAAVVAFPGLASLIRLVTSALVYLSA